jgi:protease I
MATKLLGYKIAVLAADGVEQSEFFEPLRALEKAGAEVKAIANKTGTIRAWNHMDWGRKIEVDLNVDEAVLEEFDALLLPGGVLSADKLRIVSAAVEFVKDFFERGKPVATIGHGAQILIECDVLHGRKLTSSLPLRNDFYNAGANWVDLNVAVDDGLVSSRGPDDIPAFNIKMIEEFAAGPRRLRNKSPRLTRESRLH